MRKTVYRVLTACFIVLAGLQVAQVRADESTDTEKRLSALEKDSAKLKGLKISGYIQARYESHQGSENSTYEDGAVSQNNSDNIYIRRGRLKVEYQTNKTSKYRIYFDGAKDKLKLLEAWMDLNKKSGKTEASLRVGQQNIPFGFEIEHSSSHRDFPERSTAERTLFEGERDRAINLTVKPDPHVAVNVAVLNGTGIGDKTFTYKSPFKDTKDILGRIRLNGKTDKVEMSGGASVYTGKQFDMDTSRAPDFKSDKKRYGADAQVLTDLMPEMGQTALRAEVFIGEDFGKDSRGFYVWLSQRLGQWFGAAVRFDSFDPDTNVKDGKKMDQISLAGHFYFDKNVRITVAMDVRKTEEVNGSKDPKDNIFTVQSQFSF